MDVDAVLDGLYELIAPHPTEKQRRPTVYASLRGTLRRWWQQAGRALYPTADRLLVTADAGGSNGYRVRAWKTELALVIANTLALAVFERTLEFGMLRAVGMTARQLAAMVGWELVIIVASGQWTSPGRTGPRWSGVRSRTARRSPRGRSMSELSDAELDQIERRAAAATPGPWFVRFLDDVNAMNMVAVSTQPDTGQGERWPDFEQSTIIAATVVQEPRYVDIEDGRWDENARFIAHARSDIPRLVAEVRRLRAQTRG